MKVTDEFASFQLLKEWRTNSGCCNSQYDPCVTCKYSWAGLWHGVIFSHQLPQVETSLSLDICSTLNFDLFLPISHNKNKKGQKLFLIRKIVPLSLTQPCSDSSEGKKLCRSKILYYISLILLLSIYTSHMQAEKKGKGEKKNGLNGKKKTP